MCYVQIDKQRWIHGILPVILKIQKWRQKQQAKKHSFRLLIATAFRYHHYECFCSQIHLTKLTVVKGEPGNHLDKRCVPFLDAAPLKMQRKAGCFFFFFFIKNKIKICLFNSIFERCLYFLYSSVWAALCEDLQRKDRVTLVIVFTENFH